ncbi:alpha/beta fold hydrolase [Sphingomonas colocasiae]|uniref:Alpha/beta fold hydrolase n=1 Tax=Sphingomonas colocasiae TaxID=1848973 RepID=A0ABS7PQG7_9SPHN|nr:alpha/beta hydrolase [Sphingomonas colocasiae]MBY8823569.1 alpha/beta fold hydrolase [Sphingomonas colocasiae]
MDQPRLSRIALERGLEMNLAELGEGPALIFIHGSGPGASSWNNFRGNARHFAGKGYRCLMPDMVGFGHSSKPEDVDFTLDFHAGTIVRAIESLTLSKVVLIGNSLGGAVAIQVALDRPDLVDRLVLMAPGWLDEREVFAQMPGIQAMRRVLLDEGGLKLENLEQTFALMFADPARLPHDLVRERFEMAKLQNSTVYSRATGYNLSSRLKELVQPVLGFWGAADRFCPVSGALTLAQEVADCTMMISRQCGHWFMMEQSELFDREVLAFLSK